MAGFWNLPFTFASLTGNQPASDLDACYQALAVQPQFLTAVAGTNAITGTAAMPFAAYLTGMPFTWVQPITNTLAVTLQVNAVGVAQAVTKNGTTALSGGELKAGALYTAIYDGTRFQLINQAGPPASLTSFTVFATGGAQGLLTGINTTIVFTNTLFDTGSNVTLGVGGAFTAPATGIYYFSTIVTIDAAGPIAAQITDYQLLINTSAGGALTRGSYAINTVAAGQACSGFFSLASGSAVNIQGRQISGASLQTVPALASVVFSGFRVS